MADAREISRIVAARTELAATGRTDQLLGFADSDSARALPAKLQASLFDGLARSNLPSQNLPAYARLVRWQTNHVPRQNC